MAEELPSRTAEREIMAERTDAEALSRRDESMASVMRSRAMRNAALPGLAQVATDATKQETESAKAEADAKAKRSPVDYEGTAPGLADRTGTFATDIEKATAGGIGVEDSNVTGETTATNLVHTETTAASTATEQEGETAAQRKARLKAGAG